MSNRRGLSLGEKRKRTLDGFFETKDDFQLEEELEKIMPAENGVIPSLVDEHLESEKIGTSTELGAFTSKATQIRKRKLEAVENKENVINEEERVELSRKDSADREELMAKIAQLEAEQKKLKTLVDRYRDSDPKNIQKKSRYLEDADNAELDWGIKFFIVNFGLNPTWAAKRS